MAASDQITFNLPKDRIGEGSRLIVTARFRDRATSAAVTPTNGYYRLDCLTTDREIVDWTAGTATTSMAVTLTPTHNTLQSQCNVRERRRLTVAADYGLSTQFIAHVDYDVENERDIQ
jgi:hypothetical protein